MGDSENTSEEIVLVAENVSFVCNKTELAKHSDYFKVMFEGNFVEKTQRSITLQEVDARSLKIILTLLWDSSFVISEEDILLVLEAACMLQFSNIKELCVVRIREILSPSNCIKVWFGTEKLDIEDLHLKAKYLSLIEFNEIKDMNCLMELHLRQLHLYLSDVNLQCRSEFDVFFICMKWWYENCFNSEKLLYENKTKNLLHLVSALNYRALSDSDLREMLSYPDISENQDVKDLFTYFIALKNQEELYLLSELRNIVAHILNGVDRFIQKVPCFLVQNVSDDLPNKKLRVTSTDKELAVIYHDQFKRKRYYKILNKEPTSQVIVYFDINSNKFKKLLDVDQGKCDKLDGFKILSYKEFIFLFGGEYKIGRGDWNRSFWVYDNVKERWQHKSMIPQVRRHFESCIVGEFLYIIGGAGNYRIIQENMLWYNYKNDSWSKVIMLPCPGRQTQCCAFKNKLFLLNVNNKCGYFFDNNTSKWIQISINGEESIPSFFEIFTIFSYKDSLYFKGSELIETKLKGFSLDVVNSKVITTRSYDSMESVLCNDIVYSLYRRKPDDGNCRITLEKLHMDTLKIEYIFEDIDEDSVVKMDEGNFKVRPSTFLFSFQHWKLVKGNNFVNNFAATLFNE